MLHVDQNALTLGNVYAGTIEWNIPVTNTSSHPVQLSEMTGSCDCTSISPRRLVIAPGGTAHLALHLNLAGKSGPWSTRVVCRINDTGRMMTLPLTGHVRPLFRHEPTMPLVRIPYPDTEATVRLELAGPVDTLDVTSDTSFLQPALQLLGDDVVLMLRITEEMPFGLNRARLRFTTHNAAQQRSVVLFPVHLDRVAPYTIRPQVLNLGRIPAGGRAEGVVLVSCPHELSRFNVLEKPMNLSVHAENSHESSLGSVAMHQMVVVVRVDNARHGLQSETITASLVCESREVKVLLLVTYCGD